MATMYEVAKEIEKETGVNVDTVMQVLKALGNAMVKTIDAESEPRIHIPGFGVLKIEKEKRKKYPSFMYYPSPMIQKYLKNKTV